MVKTRQRPYVICHMVPSIDGRIVVDKWPLPADAHALYERAAASIRADAWMVGRVSMAPFAGRAEIHTWRSRTKVPRTDYVAPHDAATYAVALDPSGKLRWGRSEIDGEHVITVLTTAVSDRYLAHLRAQGVSYVFGGRRAVDVRWTLEKLRALFGIERLLLEGGGKINGSFLGADAIDELSVLLAPVADGTIGTPTLFDSAQAPAARRFVLGSLTKKPGDMVWLRYRRAR